MTREELEARLAEACASAWFDSLVLSSSKQGAARVVASALAALDAIPAEELAEALGLEAQAVLARDCDCCDVMGRCGAVIVRKRGQP